MTCDLTKDLERLSVDMDYIEFTDFETDAVVIKINRLYKKDMSSLELYEATRGIWRAKMETVSPASYALSVANQIVVEVYRIDSWEPASEAVMQTRTLNPERCKNRIAFIGKVADETVRNKYVGKSVAHLYKFGEANPIKLFNAAANE